MSISPAQLYIGQKGYFDFHSPFDQAYHLNELYLVIEQVASINNLVLNKIDIEKTYFTPYGLSKAQYIAFLNDNGVIVTFKAPTGKRYDVPNTFLKSLPNKENLPYRQLGLNIVFGPMPVDFPLDVIQEQIQKAVRYTFGVDAVVNMVPLSPILLMPKMSPPNTPAYYDALRQSLEELSLMISAVDSVSADMDNL